MRNWQQIGDVQYFQILSTPIVISVLTSKKFDTQLD